MQYHRQEHQLTDPILTEWAAWQTAQGLSDRTISERIATIRNMLEHTGADAVTFTARDIIRFCGRSGINATTRATYHASIRAYAKWLVFLDFRPDNPCDKTMTPRRNKSKPRPVTDEQLERILYAVNRRRTRTYVLLAALAGLRVHEIAKIRGKDFTPTTLTVQGKGASTWTVPLHPLLAREAEQYPAEGYWFPSYAREGSELPHIQSHAVSKAIREAMFRAGFAGKPHQLRHWFGTTLANQGVDLGVVQKLMRHESPATTVIYADVRFGLQLDGITRLDLPNAA